jgi:hypothetical protein
MKISINGYCKVASRPVYCSILNTFGQTSQYISIKLPFIDSLKILICATNQDSLLLATLWHIISWILKFSARGYPNLHMAIIYDNGKVWNFSFMNKTLVMRNHLFQLPKSMDYFGYSDENGILYFIHSDAEKSITKYHKSFSKLGHKTVANSKRKEGPGYLFPYHVYGYHYGALLGKIFWAFGKYISNIVLLYDSGK